MLTSGQLYRLSRFAMLETAKSGGFVLSSPLSRKQFAVKSETIFRLLLLLGTPVRIDQILESVSASARSTVEAFLVALDDAELLTIVDEDGNSQDRANSFAHWEFHDLLFHSRSRTGRHANGIGGTYRFKGVLEEEPALRRANPETVIKLPASSKDECSAGLAEVLDRRRSWRSSKPLGLAQLSALLYRCCRVTNAVEDANGSYVHKVYPSGGGMHPLEVYVLAHSCTGLAAGLYRYSGMSHELEPIRKLDERGYMLLEEARFSAGGMPDYPAVLVIIAARFRRTAWKYEGIAYRLMLLEAGTLIQTFCLVSEAIGLACCALGCGNSDLFSELAGSDYYMETSIAELILGGRRTQ